MISAWIHCKDDFACMWMFCNSTTFRDLASNMLYRVQAQDNLSNEASETIMSACVSTVYTVQQ